MIGTVRDHPDAGTPDGSLCYAPHFDLRNVGLEAMRIMVDFVGGPSAPSLYDMEAADLTVALQRFSAGVQAYLDATDDATLTAHLIAAEFHLASPVAQTAILTAMGAVFLSMFAEAVTHCTTTVGMDMPYQPVLNKFLGEVREATARLLRDVVPTSQPAEAADVAGQDAAQAPMS